MSTSLTPMAFVKSQWFTNNGDPADGYQLFVYSSGSSTKVDTWADAQGVTLNANPVVLDSSGRHNVFVTPGQSYKFVMAPPTDTDPPTSPIWTVDEVLAIPTGQANVDFSGTFAQTVTAGQVVYMSDGSSGETAGEWYLADADTARQSTRAHALGFAVSNVSIGDIGLIRESGKIEGLAGIIAGTLYYVSATAGGITSSAPTNARPIGMGDVDGNLIVDTTFANYVDASVVVADSLTVGTTAFNSAIPASVKPGGATTYSIQTDGIFYASAVPVTTAGTSEEFFNSFTIPGGTFNGTGRQIVIDVVGVTSNSAGHTKVFKVYFGATSVVVLSVSDANATFHSHVILADLGATSQAFTAVTAFAPDFVKAASATPAETASGNVVLRTSLTTATAAGEITLKSVIYRFEQLKTS